jgi:H+/Cl- antiporter ClcA
LAVISGSPIDLFAKLGFIAVFAGAVNKPIACTLMGIELFGTEYTVYFAIACFTAYYFSGHSGIYHSQQLAVSKFHQEKEAELTPIETKET